MRFRDDIDLDATFVTSDTHYGHDNIVGFCHRPEEHDQVMLAEWRKVAIPGVTMLHLGDLSYKSNAHFKHIIAKELTGDGTADRNLLIKGNHDKQSFKFYKDCGFKLARPFALKLCLYDVRTHRPGLTVWTEELGLSLPTTHVEVSFAHYPWNDEEDGGPIPDNHLRVHGHIHNNGYQRYGFVPFLKNHLNLSVEQTGYKPVNLRYLLEAAILGKLPGDAAREAELAEKARQRSILLRTAEKPS